MNKLHKKKIGMIASFSIQQLSGLFHCFPSKNGPSTRSRRHSFFRGILSTTPAPPPHPSLTLCLFVLSLWSFSVYTSMGALLPAPSTTYSSSSSSSFITLNRSMFIFISDILNRTENKAIMMSFYVKDFNNYRIILRGFPNLNNNNRGGTKLWLIYMFYFKSIWDNLHHGLGHSCCCCCLIVVGVPGCSYYKRMEMVFCRIVNHHNEIFA